MEIKTHIAGVAGSVPLATRQMVFCLFLSSHTSMNKRQKVTVLKLYACLHSYYCVLCIWLLMNLIATQYVASNRIHIKASLAVYKV